MAGQVRDVKQDEIIKSIHAELQALADQHQSVRAECDVRGRRSKPKPENH